MVNHHSSYIDVENEENGKLETTLGYEHCINGPHHVTGKQMISLFHYTFEHETNKCITHYWSILKFVGEY
jgi:hypothetical protein